MFRVMSDLSEPPSIQRLPNELLSEILLWCAEDLADSTYCFKHNRPQKYSRFQWLPLTLVCRRWRKLAMGNPRLWHVVDVYNLHWLELVLPRSGHVPVDMAIHSEAMAVAAFSAISLHSHRIRTLRLPPLRRKAMQAVLCELVALNTPMLKQLEFSHYRSGEYQGVDLPAFVTTSLSYPALNTIRLSRLVLRSVPQPLSRLRCLDLRSCAFESCVETLDQLLDVLEQCADLEELQLRRILSPIARRGPQVPLPTSRLLVLPRLRKFVLEDYPRFTAWFLSCIRLPSTDVTIRLIGIIDGRSFDGRYTQSIASLMPRDRSRFPILRSITSGRIDTLCTIVKIKGKHDGGKVTLKFPIDDIEDPDSHFPDCVDSFRMLFAGSPLDCLRLGGDYASTDGVKPWVELFTAFPTLDELVFFGWGYSTIEVFSALGRLRAPSDEDSDKSDESFSESGNYMDDQNEDRDGDDEESVGEESAVVCPDLSRVWSDYLNWYPGLVETILATLRARKKRGCRKLDYLGFALQERGGGLNELEDANATMDMFRDDLSSLVRRLDIVVT